MYTRCAVRWVPSLTCHSKEVCAELWPFFHTYVRQRLELATVGWSAVPLKLPKSEREAIRELLETIHRCFGGVPAAVVKANPAFYCIFSPAKDHQTELQVRTFFPYPPSADFVCENGGGVRGARSTRERTCG